jgi:uncharacterized protein with PIN domain
VLFLYIETNLIMAIAKGQDEQAEQLLNNIPANICLMIPSICYMEAIVALQNERKRRKDFLNNVKLEITESERSLTSDVSSLVNDLEKARLAYDQFLNEFEGRFLDAITLVRTKVTSIDLPLNSLIATLTDPILSKEKQLRDNLILQCILDHAQLHPTEQKVLLTSNSVEFGKPEVQQILQQFGIIKDFTNTKSFMGWLGSQNI